MIDEFRRRVTLGLGGLPLLALLAKPCESTARTRSPGERAMNVICHIRYEIDPYKRDLFERYARAWITLIPKNGGVLLGYFMPYEGTNYVAHAMIGFETLEAYAAYHSKLAVDPPSVANFQFAQREKFILREDREWLRTVKPA